jgi:glutaredoxin
MSAVEMYCAQSCGYCSAAENLLRRKGDKHCQKFSVNMVNTRAC